MQFVARAIAFIKTWWMFGLAVLAAVSTSFVVGQCSGKKIGREQMQLAVEKANTKALEQARRADALAANQRITDTIAVSTREQELRNAIASTPDSAPDAVRIRLGCERLRRAAGANPASLPAVCGSPGRAQAGPAR